MRFLEQIGPFAGTGERNAKGETLEEFLEHYDPKKYDCPSNTVDMLIFRSEGSFSSFDQRLRLLMVRRSNHPSIGAWALPGGFADLRENLEDAAARELKEETGVTGLPLIQLHTYGDFDRDPRWRVITTAYLALIEHDIPVEAGDDAADALWMDVLLKGKLIPAEESENSSAVRTLWTLSLENPDCGISLTAQAEETIVKRGILTDRKLRQCTSKGIASDHGMIIIDALLYLKNLIS